MAELEWEDSPQPRPADLPRPVRDMSSEVVARLHSRGAPPAAQQATAADTALERPKTPVQYVRSPAGPSPPLPNPFAGFVESIRAASPEPHPSAASAEGRQVAPDLAQQGRPPTAQQPSAARKQKAAKKPAAWEMLVEGGDEPRKPREPVGAERSALPEAPLPKMAMRFQMLIDSQKMEEERQVSSSTGRQPSHSAAAYPAGSPRQVSAPQQGHQSMPHLRRPPGSPLPTGQPDHGQIKQGQEHRSLLLGAYDTGSASHAEPGAVDSHGLQQESSSQVYAEKQPGGLAAGEAGPATAGQSGSATSPSAAAQLEAITRWERMLDRRASQSQAAPASVGASSIPQAPAPQHSAAASTAPAQEEPFSSQSLQAAPALGPAPGSPAAAHGSTRANAQEAPSFQAAQGSPPIVAAQRSAVSSSGSAAAHSSTDVQESQPGPGRSPQQPSALLANLTSAHSQAHEGVLQGAGQASSSSSSRRMPQDDDREASKERQIAESSTEPLRSAIRESGEASWPSGLAHNSEEVGALSLRFLLHDTAIQTHPNAQIAACTRSPGTVERGTRAQRSGGDL